MVGGDAPPRILVGPDSAAVGVRVARGGAAVTAGMDLGEAGTSQTRGSPPLGCVCPLPVGHGQET